VIYYQKTGAQTGQGNIETGTPALGNAIDCGAPAAPLMGTAVLPASGVACATGAAGVLDPPPPQAASAATEPSSAKGKKKPTPWQRFNTASVG